MYAVIETGGKQYRVQPGDIIQVEKIEGDRGTTHQFDQVIFFNKGTIDQPGIIVGQPSLQGAVVEAEFVGQGRGEKILIIKMKRRKQYRRTQGHRQYLTQFLITSIASGLGDIAKLEDAEKAEKLKKFQSHLKPKGLAFSKPRAQTQGGAYGT